MDTQVKEKILQCVEIPGEEGTSKVIPLREAVRRYVRPGMTLHFCYASTTCYATMYEVMRQYWQKRPDFTVAALGLLAVAAPFVYGGLAKRLITTYAGDAHPSPGPNPIYQKAYREGRLEIENWSLLTYTLRLKAGALDCGFLPTKSLLGSSMEEENKGSFERIEDPFRPGMKLGAVSALKPDLSLCHAVAADPHGNAIIANPQSENFYGAMASKEGVLVSAEKIVSTDFIRKYSHLVRIPGYLVKSVSEVPFGAHPAALNSFALPEVEGYGIDYAFLIDARKAARKEESFEKWVRYWVLECEDRRDYLKRLGTERLLQLKAKAHKDAWFHEFEAMADHMDDGPEATPAERMIIAATYKLMERVRTENYKIILAGIGASNLAAWLATYFLKSEGYDVDLTAEVGFYGYLPRPMDPFIFNHANIPSCKMATDTFEIMGIHLSGNPGACIGALSAGQVDRHGNINTTKIPPNFYITGSGGGNDVASGARECLVTAIQGTGRFVERVAYVTSPGDRVRTLVSDLGIFEKPQGQEEFVLTGYMPVDHEGGKETSVRKIKSMCGWDLKIASDLVEIPSPDREDLSLLRSFDPKGHFLR